ncbi:MAG: TetR/AcrR family transcriptional regulator [Burkholderiales bacterium]|nr:MAG: TetR/AcrR family transcriptional regulator [Burkholderiales bacterium]
MSAAAHADPDRPVRADARADAAGAAAGTEAELAPRGPQRRDATATRARILRAATQEFARHGFGGARGDRIARRARSSERMVYYYFGSKEGLFREVLEAAYDALGVAEQALVLDDKAPREALAHFCRFVWRWYAEHPEFIGVLTAENQLQARHLRRSARLDVLVRPVVRMLAGLLERGQRDGVFRPGLDAADLYVSIAGLGYFRVSNRYTLSAVLGRDLADPQVLDGHWRACEDMVLRYVDARLQSAG